MKPVAARRTVVALFSLVCAVPLMAQASASAPAPATRDGRRETLRVMPGRLELIIQADRPGEPSAPEIRHDGVRVRLRESGRRRYGGELPGAERRYTAKLPIHQGESALEIRETDPGAALMLSVVAPLCLHAGGAGRLLVDRDGVQAVGEIFPCGAPVRFTMGPAVAGVCPAPALPPPPEGGRRNAHLNHSPHHDGVFFMAADGTHHLEMTCACNRLTLYLYDDRVLPLPAAGFSARIEGLVGGIRPLTEAEDGTVLATPLPAGVKLPLDLTLRATLAPGLPEERFDFHFPFCEACDSVRK